MSLFGKEFYPTPDNVIDMMVKPYLKEKDVGGISYRYMKNVLSGRHILEPSAGKGDILNRIHDEYDVRSTDVYCCEIETDLKYILQEKGWRVIASDFLTYNGDYYFDLILMNPPFSNGVDHLLHAWKILQEGDIVCLLNQETILNPYTEKRQHLLNLINEHGSYELIGPVFDDAERKTGVEVALVRMHKEDKNKKFKFEFSATEEPKMEDLDETSFEKGVAVYDIIETMISQYKRLTEVFIEYIKLQKKIQFFSTDLFGKDSYIQILDIVKETKDDKVSRWYNNFISTIQQKVWTNILGKTNIQAYMTHQVRQNFSKFMQHQSYLEFTREHVEELVQLIFENRLHILENAIVEVFEIFTRHHAENRYLVEGWKTNDRYKVNRKIILPWGVEYGKYSSQYDLKQYGDTFSINYNTRSEYSDIDKVMAYLMGHKRYQSIEDALDWYFKVLGKVYPGTKFDNTCSSTYFDIKFFKKGTIHLYFRDEKLWQEFNYRACFGKKWLPEKDKRREDKGKERYHDPSPTILENPVTPDEAFQIPESTESATQSTLF